MCSVDKGKVLEKKTITCKVGFTRYFVSNWKNYPGFLQPTWASGIWLNLF